MIQHATIYVYLHGGIVHSYPITAKTKDLLGAKAREHCAAIAMNGFRANDGKREMTWFMPHWIDKIKVLGDIPTGYPSTITGT